MRGAFPRPSYAAFDLKFPFPASRDDVVGREARKIGKRIRFVYFPKLKIEF